MRTDHLVVVVAFGGLFVEKQVLPVLVPNWFR